MATPKATARLGERLPDLVGDSQVGVVRARDLLAGAWGLVVAFPATPHPVWASELGVLHRLAGQLTARHCRVLAVSGGVASKRELLAFLADVNETQDVRVGFPVVADVDGELCRALGLVAATAPPRQADANLLPLSAALLLDLDSTVRLALYYPVAVGRNFYELLRALDALQLATFHPVVTPANWRVSDDVFVAPSLDAGDAKRLFPQGVHEVKPFLRLTAAPSLGDDDEDGGAAT